MKKKAIVIGLGSMGKRRIRLIKQHESDIEIIGVDARTDRCEEVEKLYGVKTCNDLETAFQEDAVCSFVCTSPLSHAKIINQCLSNGLHVFSEINLVADDYEENIELARKNGLVLFLSSTFLYRDEIAYIRKAVNNSESMLSYSYHIGQYLPDWHPWENYTDYFIGDSRTNGCREIMAIDFPWIYKTFGKVKDICVKKNKKTKLNISYNDSYLMLVEHEDGTQGTILVDVVSRKAVRNLEIYGEDLYLSWNGQVDGLKEYDIKTKEEKEVRLYQTVDRQEGYAAFVVENAYNNEINAFFNEIETGQKAEYGFEDDKEILKLIDRVEGK